MEGLPITPWTVFLYALLTAVATGLGALPFLFTRGITPRHLGLANAAAADTILVFMTLLMNGLAIYLRFRLRKNIKW